MTRLKGGYRAVAISAPDRSIQKRSSVTNRNCRYIDPIEWAPVHWSIAGPDIFVSAKDFWYTPVRSQDLKARGLCASILRICSDCWRRNEASSCRSPQRAPRPCGSARSLACAPVASCSSPRVVRRTCVRIRCLSFDHMIGRQYPRSVEPNAPLPRQVQHRKCCGR